ncbi:MAG TPA: hypothetical protein P5555_10135 [Candidatus Paceibacterota bacterium]|nr:hypothetical protein [Verrucomicrobiota bacterium]HRZ45537.1 hypothetical protein [Candidatus Paceibacterota bacterium]HRZ93010.1 hypothetical protein [Candidatus Paceibacterota bacterium]
MKRTIAWMAVVIFSLCAASAMAEIKVDVGGSPSGGPPAPAQEGWIGWITPDRVGNTALSHEFSADFDASFTVAFDSVDTRQRSTVNAGIPLAQMLTTAFKRSTPIVMRFQGLAAGSYELKMWHHDGNNDAKPTIDIVVTDADSADRLAVDDLKQSWGTGPVLSQFGGSQVGPPDPVISTVAFRSDGVNEAVVTVRDNDDVGSLYPGAGSNLNESFIAGFQLSQGSAPVDILPTVNRLTSQPFGFTIDLTQTPPRLVNTNTVQVALDGAAVPVEILVSNELVRILYSRTNIFPSGSTHPVELAFDVTGTPATNLTASLSFVVPVYRTLGAQLARPAGTVDLDTSGFRIRAHQTRFDASLTHNITRAENQIRGQLIDPLTGQPYANHITGGPEFIDEDYLNWDLQQAGSGNFSWLNNYFDEPIPGLPGDEFSGDNAAFEMLTHLELKAGLHTLGVNSDDGFRISLGQAPQDLFAPQLMAVNGTRTAANTTTLVYVPTDGLYPIRLLYFQAWDGVASLEFFSVDAQGNKWLINDRAQTNAIRAYRNYTGPALPYVQSVSPAANAATLPVDTAIEARLVDLGSNPVKMYLNGAEVAPTSQTVSNVTTLRYQPPEPLAQGLLCTVGIAYGSSSNSWSFRTIRGPKIALVVANPDSLNPSDAGVKARLETFGFEVVPLDDNTAQVEDLQDMILLITSATLSSGNVGGRFTLVPIPILNWEVGLQNDYLMTLDGSADHDEPSGQTTIDIVNPAHPIAAGFTAGPLVVVSSAQTFTWGLPNTNTADVIATIANNPSQPCIYAYETGDLMIDGATPAPGRRVHIFLQENAFASLNPAGLKLFDAAASWALGQPLVMPEAKFDPPAWQGGQVRISWTGPGVLEFADSIGGAWTPLPNAPNPLLADPALPARFYRIRQ